MTLVFSGWSDAAFDFYRRLEAENNRTFWLANKATFDAEVRAPFDALSELVAEEFGSLYVFRPNRDVRFSKDKSPYKTACYGVAEGEGGEGFYVGMSAAGVRIGSGYWMMATDQLARFRAAVADDATGPDLVRVVSAVRAAGLELDGESLKTAPKGYPRDHPRIELLRCKSIVGMASFEPSPDVAKPSFADTIRSAWRSVAPMNAWLAAHVGPSTLPPDERGGR